MKQNWGIFILHWDNFEIKMSFFFFLWVKKMLKKNAHFWPTWMGFLKSKMLKMCSKDFTDGLHHQWKGLKFKYCRRRVFGNFSRHASAVFKSDTAIDKIRAIYGKRLSIYHILEQLVKDRKDWGRVNLRI